MPPLDDPRWVPMITWLHLRSEQTTGHRLHAFATAELTEELKSEKRHCMRRSVTNPSERERVLHTAWNDHEIDVSLGFVQIYRGSRGPYGRDPHSRIEGWMYYVWPDLDPQAEQVTSEEKVSLKRRMILAIAYRENPGGWDNVPTADILHQVENGWAAECTRWGVDPKVYPTPKRHGVELALGRRDK